MLEKARRQGASIFIYLIFCLLIAIFVINFGPQGGTGGGCSSSSNLVISVDGEEASQSSYHVAYANGYNRGTGKQKAYVALETLIRRELLAQEAEQRGLVVTDDLIDEQIKQGRFFLSGQRLQIPGALEEIDGERFYNHKAVRGWVGSMNVSLNAYREEQKRGMLAAMMSQILQDSVVVSRDEALQHYLFENNTVQYDVVAFRPDAYRAAMKLTDADVERFLTTHAADVEARYKTDERTYKGVKPQLKLRQIFIAAIPEEKPAAPDATGADAAGSVADAADDDAGSAAGSAATADAGSGAGAGSAAPETASAPAAANKPDADADKGADKPAGIPMAEAKAKLEAARAAIESGKQTFIDAAKKLNTDEAMQASGGELGWRTAESPMLGDNALTDAVKTLEPGKMTPVITTNRGAYLIVAEDKREGDLSFDQVKHEIAKELARDVWSKEAAKRAALAAHEKALAGTGQNLDQMFEKEEVKVPPFDINQILNDPNLSQEQRQQLLQIYMQQIEREKSGALVIESDNVPASWRAQADGAGGSAPATPPTPAAGSAAPADSAPAAGSAATADARAAEAPAAPAEAPVELTASDDVLPAFGDVPPPTVRRFGPAPRSMPMGGIGGSKEAARALFDELSPGMLGKRVYEADGNYVLIQLVAREIPEVEDFDKQADRLIAELRTIRAQLFVEQWLADRCTKLAKDGKIKPNLQLVQDYDDNGKPLPIAYRPCMSFQ